MGQAGYRLFQKTWTQTLGFSDRFLLMSDQNKCFHVNARHQTELEAQASSSQQHS